MVRRVRKKWRLVVESSGEASGLQALILTYTDKLGVTEGTRS